MNIDSGELTNRIQHHAPNSDRAARHEGVREATKQFMEAIAQNVTEERELSVALTRAEEAMFWANAGIAREADRG